MRRGLVLVLLAMAFMSHLLAIAGRGDAPAHAQGDSHAVLHWKGQPHHHLADGSLAHDDSAESAQHLLMDYVLAAPWLLSSRSTSLLLVAAQQPAFVGVLSFPDPYVAGLKRPPRSAA